MQVCPTTLTYLPFLYLGRLKVEERPGYVGAMKEEGFMEKQDIGLHFFF